MVGGVLEKDGSFLHFYLFTKVFYSTLRPFNYPSLSKVQTSGTILRNQHQTNRVRWEYSWKLILKVFFAFWLAVIAFSGFILAVRHRLGQITYITYSNNPVIIEFDSKKYLVHLMCRNSWTYLQFGAQLFDLAYLKKNEFGIKMKYLLHSNGVYCNPKVSTCTRVHHLGSSEEVWPPVRKGSQ